MFWKTHVFGSVFLGSVFAKVSQIPCFCCFFKWKLRGDFQVVVLKAAKTRGFCMVDLCKVKQQASGNDHPNDCDSSNISHRPPPPNPHSPLHRTTEVFACLIFAKSSNQYSQMNTTACATAATSDSASAVHDTSGMLVRQAASMRFEVRGAGFGFRLRGRGFCFVLSARRPRFLI